MRRISNRTVEHLRRVSDLPDLSQTKYRLLERITSGGMGTVYEVFDSELNRPVALKVLNVIDAMSLSHEAVERMRNEARILARLEHPAIIPVHDVGVLPDGRPFYVMKLVRGMQFDTFAQSSTSVSTLLGAFQKICEAVAFAHDRGVLHRDLKPENVMVGAFGEVLIIDWGVAKLGAEAEANGTVIGTPAYMAPEQARGDVDQIDQRSDVYSLGAILRFILSQTKTPHRALVAISQKALALDASHRYSTVAELAADVARYLDGLPVSAYRESLIERASRWVSKNRLVVTLIVTYLLMRILFIFFIGR